MRWSRRGSALIEFAGSLIVLTATFVGLFEIGYAFFTYGTLVTAVRAGARYSASRQHGAVADPEVANAVRNLVVYGDPAPAANARPLAQGLTPANVEIVEGPDTSTVSLRGFAIDALFTKVNLDGCPTVTFPLARRGGK
ncbi:MAG TPA: TadE family protein [Bryobacteraceae bacterium]|nr:TadE family protein [Bryobacteraceae bacterium]